MLKGKCWMCGKEGKIQRHHAIPNCFKPMENRIIPLCKKCHKKVHFHNPSEVQQQLYDLISENFALIRMFSYMMENRKLNRLNRQLKNKINKLKKEVLIWREHNLLEHSKEV